MIFIHFFQYFKATLQRHHDIQKHKGNIRTISLKQFQTLLSVFRFQDLKFLPEHFPEKKTVHLRIIHDHDPVASGLFRHFGVFHLLFSRGLKFPFFCHHHIFLCFGLVHKMIRPVDSFLQRFFLHPDTADTHRESDFLIFLDPCLMDLLLDRMKLLYKIRFSDILQDQKKFISTVTHQDI